MRDLGEMAEEYYAEMIAPDGPSEVREAIHEAWEQELPEHQQEAIERQNDLNVREFMDQPAPARKVKYDFLGHPDEYDPHYLDLNKEDERLPVPDAFSGVLQ